MFQQSYTKDLSLRDKIARKIMKLPFLRGKHFTKEVQLMMIFWAMFFLIFVRLFFIEIIKHNDYETLLNKQHTSATSIKANRGDIYALNKSGKPVKLTENITLYDVAFDLTLIGVDTGGNSRVPKVIEYLTPVVYKHLCELNGMDTEVTKEECINNVELFAWVEILPKKPELFYYGTGIKSPEYDTFDFTGYEESRQQIIDEWSREKTLPFIVEKLKEKIQVWEKERNYLWFFDNNDFLKEVATLPFIEILNTNYVYVIPSRLTIRESKDKNKNKLQKLLQSYGYHITSEKLDALFEKQVYKYVKLFSSANPEIAQDIKNLKLLHVKEKDKNKIPILHGLILEPFVKRYYPYGELLSNTLGYVDKNGVAYYGIEQYFDETLRGKDGKIVGRSSSSIMGSVGANDFEIIDAKNGDDIYLTIDVWIQKEVEEIANYFVKLFKADAIAVMVYDPKNGQVKASVTAPTFNPNNYNDAYILEPLGEDRAEIIDNLTYVDVPVYIKDNGVYRLATTDERTNTELEKYIAKNTYWPQVFIDKNISVAFEPWSIFKSFTMAIGMDTDEIRLYDYYVDEGEVKVWPYTIKNATKECLGNHHFLHGLIWSCNIGMVRIVQRLGKEIFYNYLTKLGFWKLTGIELAEEKEGFVDNVTTVSTARFLNNSFWQGIQTTQIQLAAAYSVLMNGWYYIKPTIIDSIVKKFTDSDETETIKNTPQIISQIIRSEVCEEMKKALFEVMEENGEVGNAAKIEGYRLGAKSGTSQIAYKGKYQRWEWWTQGTFVGIVPIDNPEYIVLIWTSRPRTNQWWWFTSGRVFKEVAKFLIGYSLIEWESK